MSQEPIDHWLSVAKKINSIAQTGLAFTKDPYDKERYTELMGLSIQILNDITGINSEKLEFIYNRDTGYQTPKLGIRALVVQNGKILMVKEKMDNKWCIPGGYADIGLTPSQIAVTEVKEEAGFDVLPTRILGLIDYNKHQDRPFPFDVYNLFMGCEIVGGKACAGLETSDVDFFNIDNLPELSERRVTKTQIEQMYQIYTDNLTPVFD